jgi:hypothetical protein
MRGRLWWQRRAPSKRGSMGKLWIALQACKLQFFPMQMEVWSSFHFDADGSIKIICCDASTCVKLLHSDVDSSIKFTIFQCRWWYQDDCSVGLSAGGTERLIRQHGEPLKNDQARRWRIVLSNVLSQGAVMKLQLPQIVTQFTSTIQKCAPDQPHVAPFLSIFRL